MELLNRIIKKAKQNHLSPKITEGYLLCICRFFLWIEKQPKDITKKDIVSFMTHLAVKRKPERILIEYAKSLRFLLEEIMPEIYNKKYILNYNGRRHDSGPAQSLNINQDTIVSDLIKKEPIRNRGSFPY
ncbi:phage integrase N-terminal SAM-like domain-containing protein [Candidatus Woesearchaeota archaeon]|nr:phage integrase N-terminal SAM-like domain-containing protein [Candidatus Woesearchaeota archaeon]